MSVFKAGTILEISLRVGVIPLNVTPQVIFLTNFLSLYLQRVEKPFQRTLSAVFCTKHRLNNFYFSIKNHFWSVQRVVSRPLRPIARMAPGL